MSRTGIRATQRSNARPCQALEEIIREAHEVEQVTPWYGPSFGPRGTEVPDCDVGVQVRYFRELGWDSGHVR